MSALPSPSKSYAYMSAQAGPSLSWPRAGWYVHGASVTFAGCSHQPAVQITSSRPSPLTSPTPRPCENFCVPGISLPVPGTGLPSFIIGATLGSLIGCMVHGLVGSWPGSNHAICPSLPLPLGCQPMTMTRLPLPNRSTYCGVSLQALCQISCFFQSPSPLLPGFSYHANGSPGKSITITSG